MTTTFFLQNNKTYYSYINNDKYLSGSNNTVIYLKKCFPMMMFFSIQVEELNSLTPGGSPLMSKIVWLVQTGFRVRGLIGTFFSE